MKHTTKLIIIVTKECNRNCPFCIDRANKKYCIDQNKYVNMEVVKKAIDFAKNNGIKTIALNGGEPTLHPQIVETAKMIKSEGFLLKLFTNYDYNDVVKKLDGIVDIIRISYYGKMDLPNQKDFISNLTLKIMLTKETFPNLEDLIYFINANKDRFSDLKIHTLMQNNDYSIKMQVDYLEYLEKHYPLKRNEKGDYYHDFMGYQIEREDLPNLDYEIEERIYKVHMNGTISHYFEEDYQILGNMNQRDIYTKVLRAHRNEKYRMNVMKAYSNGTLDISHCDKYLPKEED